MPRNGSGTYSLPAGNPVVTGTTISSTWANNTLSDIGTALTGSLAKDGQTVPTANMPMGAFKFTGLGDGSALTDSAALGQVQSGAVLLLATVVGTNTITAVTSPVITAYASGQTFRIIPANTTTAATTINLNSLGAKNVFAYGAACTGGELRAGVPAELFYDGTQFNILGSPVIKTTLVTVCNGFTVDPSVTVAIRKIDTSVLLTIPTITGTSDSTGKALNDALPAAFRPTAVHEFQCSTVDNSGTAVVGIGRISNTTGVISFHPTPAAGNWTNSGMAAITQCSTNYNVS